MDMIDCDGRRSTVAGSRSNRVCAAGLGPTCRQGWTPVLSEDQKRELDRRLAGYQAYPANVFTWDEVESHLRRQR